MYVCICNAITENDIKENPELKNLMGTVCGRCIDKDERMISITDNAIEKLKEFIEPWEIIRLAIEGGGCQGFQYRFGVQQDDELLEEDHVVKNSGLRLCVDPVSYMYLENVEIDYIDLPFTSKFKINNPDTKSTCGCGSSFS